MRRQKKDPSKLEVLDPYDIEGKVSDLIAKLQRIVDRHPNAVIDYKLDYGMCYYEGDMPEVKFTIRSKHQTS